MFNPRLTTVVPILILRFCTLALGGFTCGAKYFLKSANSDNYYTAEEPYGHLVSFGTHRGWYQQFTVCRDSAWAPSFFVLKSEAMSASNGADSYVVKTSDGEFYTLAGTLTGNHLFEWARSEPYWGLVHAESGGYLTAQAESSVYLGPKNLGWDQALWRET